MKVNEKIIGLVDGYSITQRKTDNYYNATDLLYQWNKEYGNTKKEIKDFLDLESTKELIDEINRKGVSDPQKTETFFVHVIRGRVKNNFNEEDTQNVLTWLHPILFIYFLMWVSPQFSYRVLNFCNDVSITYRTENIGG
jgi:hypothetical protein